MDPQKLFDEMVAAFICLDFPSAHESAMKLRDWLKNFGRPPRVLTATNRFTLNMAAVNGVLKFVIRQCEIESTIIEADDEQPSNDPGQRVRSPSIKGPEGEST